MPQTFFPYALRWILLGGLMFHASFSQAQTIPTVDYAGLQSYMAQQGDSVVVYNLWATWCRPCVAELPYFSQLDEAYAGRDLKVVLVSLDFPQQKAQLEAFVKRRGLQAEVIHLDERDQNAMINGISPEWSGAIPATLVVGPGIRAFQETSFASYEELADWIGALYP